MGDVDVDVDVVVLDDNDDDNDDGRDIRTGILVPCPGGDRI